MNWWSSLTGTGLNPLHRGLCCAGVLASAGLASVPAAAQTAAGTAQAAIVEPLGLVKVQDLQFGRVAPGTGSGTITVNANTGVCTASGGVKSAGGCGFAQFAGQGARRMTLRIQVPASISLIGPAGSTMIADAITLGASPDLVFLSAGNGSGNGNGIGGAPRYEIMSDSGIFAFRLGGRLNVAAGQRPGQYTGTFPVTVQYQ